MTTRDHQLLLVEALDATNRGKLTKARSLISKAAYEKARAEVPHNPDGSIDTKVLRDAVAANLELLGYYGAAS